MLVLVSILALASRLRLLVVPNHAADELMVLLHQKVVVRHAGLVDEVGRLVARHFLSLGLR